MHHNTTTRLAGESSLAPAGRFPSLVLATAIVALVCTAGSVRADALHDRAAQAFAAGDWTAAAAAYALITEATPDDATAWFRLGACRQELDDLAGAAAAYDRALHAGGASLPLLTRAAAVAARSRNFDAAFDLLARAVEAGLPDTALTASPAFNVLRDDHRFAPLVARAAAQAHPCSHRPENRQFDFWVGAWVVTAGNRVVGHNVIARRLDGCMLFETWTGVAGGHGHSINFWDPAARSWTQTWVSDRGDVIWGRGGLIGGAMCLTGEHILASGARRPFRMTFTPHPDGSVRQLLEESTDNGASWTVWFDGIYRREPPDVVPSQ